MHVVSDGLIGIAGWKAWRKLEKWTMLQETFSTVASLLQGRVVFTGFWMELHPRERAHVNGEEG